MTNPCVAAALMYLALVGCQAARTQSDGATHKSESSAAPLPATAAPHTTADAGVDSAVSVEAGPAESQAWPWQGWPAVGAAQAPQRLIGFSTDDMYLGYQGSTGDAAPPAYWFQAPGKPLLYFEDFNGTMLKAESEEAQEKRRAAFALVFQAKLERIGAETYANSRKLRGPFPYSDINFAFRVDRHEELGSITVWMGAQIRGEQPVLPIALVLGPSALVGKQPTAELAGLSEADKRKARLTWIAQFAPQDPDEVYANVTRDGSEIGFVAQAPGSMWVTHSAQARRRAKLGCASCSLTLRAAQRRATDNSFKPRMNAQLNLSN